MRFEFLMAVSCVRSTATDQCKITWLEGENCEGRCENWLIFFSQFCILISSNYFVILQLQRLQTYMDKSESLQKYVFYELYCVGYCDCCKCWYKHEPSVLLRSRLTLE